MCEAGRLTKGEKPMVAFHHDNRIPAPGSNPMAPVNRLVLRVRHYFDRHPEAGREEFLLDAIRREVSFREREETRHGSGTARREGEGTHQRSAIRPPPSAEHIRIRASVAQRLAVLHYERCGLWPKLRRFLFGKHNVR
jgi:hypothetical protein